MLPLSPPTLLVFLSPLFLFFLNCFPLLLTCPVLLELELFLSWLPKPQSLIPRRIRRGPFRLISPACVSREADFNVLEPNLGKNLLWRSLSVLALALRLQGMEPRTWFKAVVLMCLLALGFGRELKTKHAPIYDPSLARKLAEFTAAASVGFSRDMNAVIVVFRGTQENSIQNWIEDLFWKQLDLDYPGMPGAKVHSGFYSAYHNTTLRDGVVGGIQKTKEVYGNIPVMVTGHSMGGAMASFCALDLVINYGLKNVTLVTYGQPRIGNAVFASHFKRYLPNAIRVTNAHDIVPHLPPYYQYFPQKTYHHFPQEVWIHNVELGSLVYPVEEICDGSGEDPTCSRSVRGNSVRDHIQYLGISMHAESWGSCRIVTHDKALQYNMDPAGNIVLSKHPGLPVHQQHSAQ